MSTLFKITLGLFLLTVLTQQAFAGPNWQAIEESRAAKQEQKQIIKTQVSAHESALEKLKLACEKVKQNEELTKACAEIINVDADINTSY